ncbi:MAG: hypothetical protein OXF56_10205 [Rhodobacteraceae bacterium]|nr:hypothetical protein [Paracoccaceae bacterium]
MPVAVIVDWYGPYTDIGEFIGEARLWETGTRTLYMALRDYNVGQYVCMTQRPNTRPIDHPGLQQEENKKFFIGEIATQGISGRRNGQQSGPERLAVV